MDKIQIIMDRCDSYIRDHWKERIDRGTLAELVGYSENHLSHIFPKYHNGRSIPAYVRKKRMEHVIIMIIKGMAPTKLALESGYTSYHSFIRAFKEEFGMTVSEYHDHIMQQQKNGLSPAVPQFLEFPDQVFAGYRLRDARASKFEHDYAAWRYLTDRFTPPFPEGAISRQAISFWLQLEKTGVSDFYLGYKVADVTDRESGDGRPYCLKEADKLPGANGELLPFDQLLLPGTTYAVFNVTDEAPEMKRENREVNLELFADDANLGFLLRAMWIYIFNDWFLDAGSAWQMTEGRTAYEYYEGTTVRVAVPVEKKTGHERLLP